MILNLAVLFAIIFGVSYILSFFRLPYYLEIIIFGLTVAVISILANRFISRRRGFQVNLTTPDGRRLTPEEKRVLKQRLIQDLENERLSATPELFKNEEFLKRQLILASLYLEDHEYSKAKRLIEDIEGYVIDTRDEELINLLKGIKSYLTSLY